MYYQVDCVGSVKSYVIQGFREGFLARYPCSCSLSRAVGQAAHGRRVVGVVYKTLYRLFA